MSRLFIGLMSGTSVDAIDAALVRITTNSTGHYKSKVLHHTEHPWPKQLRQRLLQIMAPAQTTTEELCQLNALVSHQFAQAVEKLLKQSHTSRKKITALGSHGQTVCHLPPSKSKIENQKSKIPSTLQLGDPSIISTLTRITTVANFRPADITLGGQAAPLVPWTDAALLSHPTKTRCIQNIGGIANVTYLPRTTGHRTRTTPPVLAFDTGPGNMLIDALISLHTHGKKRFDQNGRTAAKGTTDPNLFRTLQSHPYFSQRPPKSTGRELFGTQFAQMLLHNQQKRHGKFENLLHTITRLTAWSIAHAYATFLPTIPDELILCGGGAHNPTLVVMLKQELTRIAQRPQGTRSVSAGPSPAPSTGRLPAQAAQSASQMKPPTISLIDKYNIPNKSKEATSFALLAAATLDRIPANLPSVTGAFPPHNPRRHRPPIIHPTCQVPPAVATIHSRGTSLFFMWESLMKFVKPLFATLASALLVSAALAADAPKEVTLTGTLECAKCELHQTDKCQNVLKVTTGDKSTLYFLTQNDLSKDKHSEICTAPKDNVTVTGTVETKDGENEMTATKIDFPKK